MLTHVSPYGLKSGSTVQWISRYVNAAMKAEQGMVRIQAVMIRWPQIHRTERTPLVVPTPRIDPVIAWVVESGTPQWVARMIVEAAAVSAQKPPTGWSRVMPDPIVFTIRQPPKIVP